MTGNHPHSSSYRDPSGFVFQKNGKFYRQVNTIYSGNYDLLMQSGLYDNLVAKNYLIPHTELKDNLLDEKDWYITLLPQQLSFINYPYEWCFEQVKDAALLTLEITRLSIEKGMILKDATPTNIQFSEGGPVFIDTLSFEKYDQSQPWIAYRQFCETFLFPLLLSHYHKTSIQPFLSGYPEGVPVNVTAKLLPGKARFNPSVFLHVYLQNKVSRSTKKSAPTNSFSRKKMENLLIHLENITKKLNNSADSTWSDYYSDKVTDPNYLSEKERLFNDVLAIADGKTILDLGANEGYFSCLAVAKGFSVIAIDNDEQSINALYRKTKKEKIKALLPLCIDLANPVMVTGFAGKERNSFHERIKPDTVLALALIHHLAIGKNIPLQMIAGYFAELAPQLIIEFVPKEDEKVQLLLQNKKDIYPNYTREGFENAFQERFTISEKVQMANSRIIYLMKRLTQ